MGFFALPMLLGRAIRVTYFVRAFLVLFGFWVLGNERSIHLWLSDGIADNQSTGII